MAAPSNTNVQNLSLAAFLLRWILGILFSTAGWMKFLVFGYSSFISGTLKTFQDTWLPPFMVNTFLHVLPFCEIIVGALLLAGLFGRVALFVAGLLLISLGFGQFVLGNGAVASSNLIYAAIAAGAVVLHAYDRISLDSLIFGKKAE